MHCTKILNHERKRFSTSNPCMMLTKNIVYMYSKCIYIYTYIYYIYFYHEHMLLYHLRCFHFLYLLRDFRSHASVGVQSFIDEAGLSFNKGDIPSSYIPLFFEEGGGNLGGCACFHISHTLAPSPLKKNKSDDRRNESRATTWGKLGAKLVTPDRKTPRRKHRAVTREKKGTLLLVWNHIDC